MFNKIKNFFRRKLTVTVIFQDGTFYSNFGEDVILNEKELVICLDKNVSVVFPTANVKSATITSY